jgi:hypothetical protein
VVLSGAATVAVLASNVAARDVDYDAELADRLAALCEDRVAYWKTRARLAWN